MSIVRTRFAPSPTGGLHIGSVRTALFAWAFAKHCAGEFILRIEDTDLQRSSQASIDDILSAMQWLNINHDGKVYYQTDNIERYCEVISKLISQQHAYYCYCSKDELEELRNKQIQQGIKPKYNKKCLHLQEQYRTCPPHKYPVVRFNTPDSGSTSWHDLVRGLIEFNNEELDDLIIARSDGTPTYNLCVVVDDADMQITHVIRGDDHINNTPRQIQILKAMNVEIPQYAHLSTILDADGHKLSKRNNPVTVNDYRAKGILPKALLNYLARLSFGHDNHEIFSMEEFISWFEFSNISAAPARFDIDKLHWINKQYMQAADNVNLAQLVNDIYGQHDTRLTTNLYLNLQEIISHLKFRHSDVGSLADECYTLYHPVAFDSTSWQTYTDSNSKELIQKFMQHINGIQIWQLDVIKTSIKEFCVSESIKMPTIGMPVRLLLCGNIHSPSLDLIIYIIGKDIVLQRLEYASHYC